MKQSFILFGACSLAFSQKCIAVEGNNEQSERPNIIWLIAEDLSPDIRCYGEKNVYTPHIDKLAGEGMMFTNAFSSASVSSPSRSAFVTGMYQTSLLGANCHRPLPANMVPLPDGVQTLFDTFYDEGYYVDYNGKQDFNFKFPIKGLKDRDWNERKEGQPFFIVLQSYHTHRPFRRDPSRPIDPEKVEVPPCYPDHPLTRRDWANYLEDVQLLDKWVGEQIKELEQKGMLDNTLVVFFGDHGRPHVRGKQFLYEEGTKVPLVMKWFGKGNRKEIRGVTGRLTSLIDLAPTMMRIANITIPTYIQGKDAFSEGTHDFIVMARDRCGEASDNIRAIRTDKYHFIKNGLTGTPWMQFSAYKQNGYPVYTLMKVMHRKGMLTPEQEQFMASERPEFELYEVGNDPFQLNNIAAENPDIVLHFNDKLKQWQRETNDIFFDPDIEAGDLEDVRKSKNETALNWYKKANLPPQPTDEEILKYWEYLLLEKQ